MVGILCGLEILHVAGGAICPRHFEISSQVALRTLQGGVRARQGKSHKRVIETRRLPCGGVVTLLAGLRNVRARMARVRGLLEIL